MWNFDVALAVLVDVPRIVRGEPDLQVTHFPGLGANKLGDFLAGRGASWRKVSRPVHQWIVLFHHRLVFMVVLLHFLGTHSRRPLGIGGVLHLLTLQRVFAAVKVDVLDVHRDAGHSLQLLRHRYLDRIISVPTSGAHHHVANFQHLGSPPVHMPATGADYLGNF